MYQPFNTEQQLLAQLAAGSPQAAKQVYQQQHSTITHWIYKNGGNEADAADVFQEAMVVLFQKAGDESFRLTCKTGTYLFAVAKHLWFKKVEQYQKGPRALGDAAGSDEGRDWAYEEDINAHQERELHYQQLDDALDQIGEPCRSLLKAFYHHDKSMQEIAADFGYTNPDNAKTQKYKCLTRLRKLFYGVGAK